MGRKQDGGSPAMERRSRLLLRLHDVLATALCGLAGAALAPIQLVTPIMGQFLIFKGRKFMQGPASEMRTDPRIRQAYLGGNIQPTAA